MTLVNWLGHTLQADLYVSAVSPRGQAATLPMDPSQLATIRALPGVLRTRSIRAVTLETDGGPTQLLVVQHDEPDREAYRLRDGNPDIAWQRFTEGAVLVSEPYAERRGIRVGEAVTLPTPAGAKEFAVAGIFYSYASDRGAVMMTRRAYDAWWNDAGISGLSIYLDSPDSVEAVAESTRNALQPALATLLVSIVLACIATPLVGSSEIDVGVDIISTEAVPGLSWPDADSNSPRISVEMRRVSKRFTLDQTSNRWHARIPRRALSELRIDLAGAETVERLYIGSLIPRVFFRSQDPGA
ncbi:MAG: hypothetical protein IID51_14400, partial [Proteobacteria bacterium]|nr:hypothetical protein [Pseudomonadota bacterium]